MKSKILYKTGLLCGIVPLLGGLSIFFYWWAQRAFYGEDFKEMEGYALMWMIFSFFTACLGLLFMLIVLLRNKTNYLKYSLGGFLVILINIPAVVGVVFALGEIERRVYVKMQNQTGLNDVEYTLAAPGYDNYTYTLDNGETTVFYYYPKHIYKNKPGFDANDPNLVVLTVKHEQIIRKITIGRLPYGGCLQLNVGKDFDLIDDGRLIFY